MGHPPRNRCSGDGRFGEMLYLLKRVFAESLLEMGNQHTFRFIWFVVLVCVGFLEPNKLYGQARGNPFEPILRDYNTKSQKLVEEMLRKLLKSKQSFIAGVTKQASVCQDEGLDQAAKSLNDLIDKLNSISDGIAAADLIAADLLPLDTGAHHLVVEFLDETLKLDKEYAPRLDRLKQAAIKSMKQQIQKGKKLDPELAQRTAKFMSDFISVPNPSHEPEVPPLPEDDTEAELVYKRTRVEFDMAVNRDIVSQTNQLFVELYKRRTQAMNANEKDVLKQLAKIDEAFRSKKTIIDLFSESKKANKNEIHGVPNRANPSGWVMANLQAIDDSIEPILLEHVARCKSIRDRYDPAYSKLDSQWAGRNSKEIKKLFLADAPLDTRVKELSRQMRLTRERHPWLTLSYSEPLPDLDPPTMELLGALERVGKERVSEADLKDAGLRDELISKLKNLPDANEDEKSAKLELLAGLTSDYGQGIRGTLVFDLDSRLGAEAKRLLEKYLSQAETMREQVFSSHANEVAECRAKLKPNRSALVQQNDFLGAMLIDLHLARRTYPIKPIWVRVSTQVSPFSKKVDIDSSFPFLLIARNQSKGFLIYGTSQNWEWHSRDRVALGYSDCTSSELKAGETKTWTNRFRPNPKYPASKPLDIGERLKEGDAVLVPVLNDWRERKVQDLSPFGVVVHVSEHETSPQIDVIPRSVVRKID